MKKIEISSRKENTRETNAREMHITKIDEIKEQFDDNLKAIRLKFNISKNLHVAGEIEAEKDIYRSQVVFIESALDYYMHVLGIYATEQMYKSNWDKTPSYKNLMVPIDKVMYAILHPEEDNWIDEVIISHHSSKTYMSPKEIKGQLTFIVGKDFYKKVADDMYYDKYSRNSTEVQLTDNLQKLYSRRNSIVHQMDRNHSTGLLNDITEEEVECFLDFAEHFINSIHKLLTS